MKKFVVLVCFFFAFAFVGSAVDAGTGCCTGGEKCICPAGQCQGTNCPVCRVSMSSCKANERCCRPCKGNRKNCKCGDTKGLSGKCECGANCKCGEGCKCGTSQGDASAASKNIVTNNYTKGLPQVPGEVEKTGMVEVKYYGFYKKIERVVLHSDGGSIKLIHSAKHSLRDIEKMNGKKVTVRGKILPKTRKHPEEAFEVIHIFPVD